MKNSLTMFIKKTSKLQRIAFTAVIMVVIGAVASVSYISTKAASNSDGNIFTTDDGLWNYVWDQENDYKITIVGYNGTDTNVVFPSKTYMLADSAPHQFTAIERHSNGNSFFTKIDASQVKSVTIPDNYTDLGDYVFLRCTSLTTVNLPNSLTSIGGWTFSECTSLTTVNLPNGITSIGKYTFASCTSLTTVNLPNSLTSIGEGAFQDCTSLTAVNLPSSLASIGNWTFAGCTSLSSINLPSGLKVIPQGAFSGAGLKSVNISYGCTEISDSAFSDCNQLVNVVIPQSVNTINNFAFYKCTSLEKVIIPDSVTSLGSEVFCSCTSLKSVSWPKTIKEIPGGTFRNCTGLTDLSVLSKVTKIGAYAFADTGIDGSSLDLSNITELSNGSLAGLTFSQPFTVPSHIKSLGSSVFADSTISKLTIPSTVESVGSSLIGSNGNVKEIVWDSTISIPYNFINNNSYIEKVTILNNINSIGQSAFQNCTALKEVDACNVTTISDYAFRNCKALTTLNASNVTTIGDYAFYDCTSLTNISDLIASVSTINTYAFCGCSSLGKVILGSQLFHLEKYAFSHSGITELDASNVINCYLKDNVFEYCESLTKVYWNNPLQITNNYAWDFYNYKARRAFNYCTALTEFTFGPLCTNLYNGGYSDNQWFYGCSSLKDIYVLRTENLGGTVNTSLLQGTSNTETVHYYAPNSGDPWQTYYDNKGSSHSFNIVPISETAKKVQSITIDNQDDVSVEVGKTIRLTATITYTDGTSVPADANNSLWKSGGTSSLIVDNNGIIKGIAAGSIAVTVYSKETPYKSSYKSVKVVDNTGGSTDIVPATSLDIKYFYVDYTDIFNREYEEGITPFGFDQNNNGAYVYMDFQVKPANTTDQPQIEITQGQDILQFNYSYTNKYTSYINCTAYFNHLQDDDGNYKYGEVTVKLTVGAISKSFTFELKESENSDTRLSGVWFDDASQSKKNLVVGNTYQYTAFPTEWWSADPYMWYEVKYEISDSSIADLSVESVENAVTDTNGVQHTARVATVTPKKAGQVKLIAYPAGIRGWYQELILTVTDPNGSATEPTLPTVRPDDSGDPNVIWATSVSFPSSKVTIKKGNTYTLNPTIQPSNCTDELNYYSYDKSIASVDADTGVVTGIAAGEVTVGVTTSSGLNTEMKIVVIDEEVPTTSVTIPSSFSMAEGTVRALSFSRTPENATDDVTWTSSDESVVTVSGGNLTAVGEGTATVTVTSGSITKTCTVTVAKSATGIVLNTNQAEMKCGETLQLKVSLIPSGSVGNVTWTSSNTNIATVSSTGEVKAVGYGDVEITATVNNVDEKCNIFVSPNLDFKILGASIRMSDPYGIRFGIQLGKTGDFGKVKIVEYGTVMKPTEQLGSDELTLLTDTVLRVKGEVIYSETSAARVYTGVLINIPQSFFNTEVSGRGYLIYEDTNGVQHTIYTDVVSRSFIGVAQAAYDSYSQITNPTAEQQAILKKLEEILGK